MYDVRGIGVIVAQTKRKRGDKLSNSIILSSGRVCLVDVDDYEWISKTKWSDDSSGYAIRRTRGRNSTEKMHRLIMKAGPEDVVDHVNGNPSDNRKENLRLTCYKGNARNSRISSTNTSGYKGVSFRKDRGKYRAYISVNKKQISLGMFECPEEAAKKYNEAALKYFGEFAHINGI